MASGRIVRARSRNSSHPSSAQPKAAAATDSTETLLRLWNFHDPRVWKRSSRRYQVSAEKAIALGQFAVAIEMLSEGLATFPRQSHMRYLAALALARSGSGGSALRLIRGLISDSTADDPVYPEAISLAARIAKDRWSRLPKGREKTEVG